MVETTSNSENTIFDELDSLTEAELEGIISNEPAKANAAKYVLGRLLIEGTSPAKVVADDAKGASWIKSAAKDGHLPSIEYKTYYDIRFAA